MGAKAIADHILTSTMTGAVLTLLAGAGASLALSLASTPVGQRLNQVNGRLAETVMAANDAPIQAMALQAAPVRAAPRVVAPGLNM